MAIFKVPRITTEQRQGVILQIGEIVYDVDQDVFYGGDDSTMGGFLIGQNSGDIVERIELQEQDIFNKFVRLGDTPIISQNVIVTPEGGITQIYGIDYSVSGDRLVWDGLGLEGVLEQGDILIIQY
jgi:hypothetical protein